MNTLSKEDVIKVLRVGSPSEITKALREYFRAHHFGYKTAPRIDAASIFNGMLLETNKPA